MATTATIYSQILEVSKMDNVGILYAWTSTATGTLSVISGDGTIWTALTFTTALTQPAGTAGNSGININQYPWKYLMLKYVNASGSGVLTATAQFKDLN